MNRIRHLREMRGLRQIDVSKATGIDQKTLSNYENEKTNPDSFALTRLADFFGVSIDYLLGRCDLSVMTNEDIIIALDSIQKKISEIKLMLEKY